MLATCEQRHFYANKAKTETCHLCLKHLKDEMQTCKTRYDKNSKEWPPSRTRSERDTNLHNFMPLRDKTGYRSSMH